MSATTTTPVRSAGALRALAHPLRMRLLAALRTDGPATASHLGRCVGESSGATSYHLRQLARFGFVEEAPEQPSRRERVWRATAAYTSWTVSELLGDPAARPALGALEALRLEWLLAGLQAWYAGRAGWSREWVDAAVDSDASLRLRVEDLARLGEELWAVVERWDARQRPAEDPLARRVTISLQAVPDTASRS